MGKFNNDNNILRTKKMIANEYLDYLISIDIINKEDRAQYSTIEGQQEVLNLLVERLYETEEYKGVTISTEMAFWHWCTFIIGKDVSTSRRVWNRLVKNLFNDIEHNRYTCIMASRGEGKSYFMYGLYPSFKMWLFPYTEFLMVSNIPQQCIRNMRIIKDLIVSNEFLMEKASMEKENKWTEREIEYNSGYMLTLSAGTTPKGQHPNYVCVDDILTDTSAYSDEEIENYVIGQLLPCTQRKKARMIVTGTPLHSKDVYHFLMNDNVDMETREINGELITDGRLSSLGFFSKIYPIITDWEKKEVYLPEAFTWEELVSNPNSVYNIQGDLKFKREYLLICTDESTALFSEKLIRSAVSDDYHLMEKADSGSQIFVTGVDVATAGGASADFSVFITLQVVPTATGIVKIIRKVVREKGMEITGRTMMNDEGKQVLVSPGQMETIANISRNFNNSKVVVEKNNVGVTLIQELQKANISVDEFTTTMSSKDNMIRYLWSELNNKNLIIPADVTPELRELKKELLNFGVKRLRSGREKMQALSGHDDTVIALAIANLAARDYLRTHTVICQD